MDGLPLVAAVGVTLIFVGFILLPKVGPWGLVIGISTLFFGVYSWLFEPSYTSIPGVKGKSSSH